MDLANGTYIAEAPERRFTFVGTNHSFDLGRHYSLKINLAKLFGKADVILLEAEGRDTCSDSVQSFAASFADEGSNVIYMEKEVSLPSLLSKYNSDPLLIGATVFIDTFDRIEREFPSIASSDNERFNYLMQERVSRILSRPGLRDLDLQRAYLKGYNMLGALANGRPVRKALIHFIDYFISVRDYEIFGPKTLEFAALDNSKVCVIGAEHVDCLLRNVRGEPLPRPPQWLEFIGNLDAEVARCFSV